MVTSDAESTSPLPPIANTSFSHPPSSLVEAFHPATSSLSRHTGDPVQGVPPEDVLDVHNMQGNILAGFNKDYQALLFLKIVDPMQAKAWLRFITPSIATLEEAVAFNRLFKALRARRGSEPCGLAATWLNIAFSRDGIAALTSPEEAGEFLDDAFQAGLPARSGLLGDPTIPNSPGCADNWVIGKTGAVPDIVLMVASDDRGLLQAEVDHLKNTFARIPDSPVRTRPAHAGEASVAPVSHPNTIPPDARVSPNSGLTLMYEQWGATLPPPLTGHEHFGFKDGISQPAVRGRLSEAKDDYLTPRYIDPHDPRAKVFAAPGEALVQPGEFVFGYKRQGRHSEEPVDFDPSVVPSWAVNGSYLVFRRLRQDVVAFRETMRQEATRLRQQPGFGTMTPERLAAKLVGRWPSGAPVMRAPDGDDPALGANDFANNHFAFQNPSTPVPLKHASSHVPDTSAQAPADLAGLICPHAAHIRKANPRDLDTDTGGTNDTLARRILRRGIPYGDPLPPSADATTPESQQDRGLLFLCYQTSITEQFEFLTTRWINTAQVPEEGGFDIIIGQNGADAQRQRSVQLPTEGQQPQTLTFAREWVMPTGGGYFFAPSISALQTVLAA